jgi:Tol biopolymer transport system component
VSNVLPFRAALLLWAVAALMLLACNGNEEGPPRLLFTSGQALYSVRADGLALYKAGNLPVKEPSAFLSPDGKQLAFPCRADQAASGPQTDICLSPSDLYRVQVATEEKLPPSSMVSGEIAWSPDSRQLAFVTNLYENQSFTATGELYLLNVEDEQVQVLIPGTPGVQRSSLRWSPDGHYLAVVGATTTRPETTFEVVNVEDGTRLDLAEKTDLQDSVSDFAWSPDSSTLAFLHNVWRSPFPSGVSGVEIYSIAVDGSNLRRFPDLGDWPLGVIWTPDGRSLAVTAAPVGGGFPRIYMVPADGGEPHLLTPSLALSDSPTWSPDGQRLVFAGAESVSDPNAYPSLALYLADAEGGDPRQLAPGIEWVPLVAWTPDSQRVFFTSQDNPCAGGCPPGFLFSAPADGSGPAAQLTDFTVDRLLGWQP